MTAIYPRLPFLQIPSNPSYASECSSQYVSQQPSLLAEGFNIHNSQYRPAGCREERLPPLNRFHGFGRGSGPPVWAYGSPKLTPQLLRLLISAQIPKIDGKPWAWNKFTGHFQKAPKGDDSNGNQDALKREVELWFPKDRKKCQEDGRRTDQRILEARLRQRQTYDAVSAKLGERKKQAEDILLKKAGTMERGKKAYLNKMDKVSLKLLQKRRVSANVPRKSLKTQEKPDGPKMITESTKSCKMPEGFSDEKKLSDVSTNIHNQPKSENDKKMITESTKSYKIPEGFNDEKILSDVSANILYQPESENDKKSSTDLIKLDDIQLESVNLPASEDILMLTNSDETITDIEAAVKYIISDDTSSE